MPVIKAYRPQVENAPLAGGTRQAALTEEAAGASIGKGVTTFGLKLHEDEIIRQDQVALLEADRRLGEWENEALYHPERGALSKRGKDAFGVPDAIDKDLKANVEEIRKGLNTDRQRYAFDRAAQARGVDLQRTLSRHVFTEARKYEEAETENYVKNAQQSAILNYDNPERVGTEIEKARAAVVGFARRNGMGAEYQKQKLAQVESDIHVGIVNRYLSNGKDQQARIYFDEAVKEKRIAGDDVTRLEAALKSAKIDGEGLRGATAIWNEMGPKSDLDPVNTDKMVKDAESKYANDPVILKAVKQGILERASLHNASQRERLEGAGNEVWKAIEGGKSFAHVRTMTQYRMLPGKQQNEIKTWMIDRADTLKRRAEGEGDDTLYYNLMTEASSAATADKFAQTNLLDHRTKLSRAQFNALIGVQAAIRKGDDREANKLLASERQQKAMVDEALLSMKLDPTPNEKTSPAKIEQINGFRRAVREAVSAHEQRTGKNADDKTVQSIVDGLVIKGVTKPGVLWDTTGRVYELKPGETITIKVTDVPKADRAKIEDSLRRNGVKVTDAAVVEVYQARLMKLRGGGAPRAAGSSWDAEMAAQNERLKGLK